MYIADRNVYGIDLNPVAVELAEVSLWLNTIYAGGFVPWFGTQLVNGNSLIGARRQCYTEAALTATSKGLRWYENAPERVPLGTERKKRRGNAQIYHFLLGDPGMCSYSDKVIKSLEPENIKRLKAWNKKFIQPCSEDDLATLRRLSEVIDELWSSQVKLRREVESKTKDSLSVYGHEDKREDSHTTIRQKDKILRELYKSEEMRNAGPYARLKFAMDYWCALWFWPINKAELLPSRSEFLFDMSLILEGTIDAVHVDGERKQLSLFPTEMQQMALDILDTYGMNSVVDIPKLRKENPRLNLAYEIAEQNHFIHWELEFADLFAERGGFDLVIGNPPWVKVEWKEQNVLAEKRPLFAIRNFSATQITRERNDALKDDSLCQLYYSEYEGLDGSKNYMNATQNYAVLFGQQTNSFKCFLPKSWEIIHSGGLSAFVHPKGVFEDSKGAKLRRELNARLRRIFKFTNEEGLFQDVHRQTDFALGIYGSKQAVSFDMICRLTNPDQIEEYGSSQQERILHVTVDELKLFSSIFDANGEWKEARLPEIYNTGILYALKCFSKQQKKLFDIKTEVYTTEFWHETIDQNNGTITESKEDGYSITKFPEAIEETIYSAANIGSLNPYGYTTKQKYRVSSDYDRVDLTNIPEDYLIRCRYRPGIPMDEYERAIPESPWGKITDFYRIVSREFVGPENERTLTCAIAPKAIAHVNAVFSLTLNNCMDMCCLAGCETSVPYDFLVKCIGKRHINQSTYMLFPIFEAEKHLPIVIRTLLLNCLTVYFKELWKNCWRDVYRYDAWTKNDPRLSSARFSSLTNEWNWHLPLRTDYERRQALVELDVLVAMALGMTLDQLKTVYHIQFPTLIANEADTWYDASGRIVFTRSATMKNVGFSRPEWENGIKGAPAGKKFYRTITDDTLPGGPVERTIEYVAPFDRCDREKDYETAWKFFEERGHSDGQI